MREPKKWHKSTRSGGSGGNCVQWAFERGGVRIRDSKDPNGLQPLVTYDEWEQLRAAAAHRLPHPWVTDLGGEVRLRPRDKALVFTAAEWSAFHEGCLLGEGDPIAA